MYISNEKTTGSSAPHIRLIMTMCDFSADRRRWLQCYYQFRGRTSHFGLSSNE